MCEIKVQQTHTISEGSTKFVESLIFSYPLRKIRFIFKHSNSMIVKGLTTNIQPKPEDRALNSKIAFSLQFSLLFIYIFCFVRTN